MIPVIDGHNDLAWAAREKRGYSAEGLALPQPELHTDVPRLRAGGVGGQFWSVWVDPVLQGAEQVTATLEQIDFVHRLADDQPEVFALARTAADVRSAMDSGRIASLLGVEGGAQIDGSLAVLRQYARAGVRYMTLTWNRTTEWADSATDTPRHGGLSAFGREVVAEMNRIGMLVDISHVAPSTMRAALQASTRPIFASHSSALAICSHPRNVPDDVMADLGAADGVQMVTFVPAFVSQEACDFRLAKEAGEVAADAQAPLATLSQVADHIDHVRSVAGVRAVGLGGDFDGTDAMPVGLGDVSTYPALFDELRSRKWSEEELRALAHGNVLRVLEANDADYTAFMAGAAGAPLGWEPRVDTSTREGAA